MLTRLNYGKQIPIGELKKILVNNIVYYLAFEYGFSESTLMIIRDWMLLA